MIPKNERQRRAKTGSCGSQPLKSGHIGKLSGLYCTGLNTSVGWLYSITPVAATL
jgi:hypothetical protein